MGSVKVYLFSCIAMILMAADCPDKIPLFEDLPARKTGVKFSNDLLENPQHNILTYEYFYNGGGVAAGDINNDGLDDLFFTGNMKDNQLYLNEGGLKFRDITKAAGIRNPSGSWTTGVTMADVNGDGWLDIYVCFSGKGGPETRRNQLYINQQDNTFQEAAAAYGLDDPANSTHAAFLDYDRDGDLDLYLLNHNTKVIPEVDFDKVRFKRDPYSGDKLYQNQDGKFVDISKEANIKGSPLGFGLGVAISDLNQDGWPDIYVSNDYIEPDYLYINQKDGTFKDQLQENFQHISHFSMGSDINDVNNDGWADVLTLDMLPEDNQRQKLLYGPENYEQYALMVNKGFYHQNMRNMLHLNNANGTFSEIGQLAGIAGTDWSWSSLLADLDNDGWKDLFITNGYYRDYTNRDFLKYKGDYYFQKAVAGEPADTFHLVNTMTSTPIANYAYRNQQNLSFSDESECWGLDHAGFSNGAVYSDLDNDGDLDLVVNNLNERATIYRNRSDELKPENHYVAFELNGNTPNTKALHARVRLYRNGQVQSQEVTPARGFQSSVSYRLHFGLGENPLIDSAEVIWPDGARTIIEKPAVDQVHTIKQPEGSSPISVMQENTLFEPAESPFQFVHREFQFNDFKRQPMLLTMLTTCGPRMAAADVDQDGLTDLYLGGSKGNAGKLYLQQAEGKFQEKVLDPAIKFNACTDGDVVFFDADGDRDQDLYLVSGGYQDYKPDDPALQDRLYLNQGDGNFSPAVANLPPMLAAKSCARPADFDQDGDLDLFVGGRVIPGEFPVAPPSYLLINDGSGKFSEVFQSLVGDKTSLGMVTDALWTDLNGDQWPDLLIAAEYQPLRVLLNREGKKFDDVTSNYFDRPLKGLWNRLAAADFDGDGDQDFIAGNFGTNSQLKASAEQPLTLYYADFDGNGSVDPILNYYVKGEDYPFPSRDELLDQIYGLRKKYTDYGSYAVAKVKDIFSEAELNKAGQLQADILETVYLENRNGKLIPETLPVQAQFAPAHAILTGDFNGDANPDFLLAGNQSAIRIRLGVIDANFGQVFLGDGQGGFRYLPQAESGLKLAGDVKDLQMVEIQGKSYLLAGINNQKVVSLVLNTGLKQ